MGILSPVQRLFIARPDESKDQILYKWPDKNIRMFSQLTVQDDEVAVFFRDGQVRGTLGPGRHGLDGKDIPFIGEVIDLATDGNLLMAELYFVSTRQFTDLPFGGHLDTVEDPKTKMVVDLRVFGEYALKVMDPTELILSLVGTQQLEENGEITEWVKSQILKIARQLVSQKVSSQAWSIIGIAQYHEELEKAVLEEVRAELEEYGIEVYKLGNVTISMKDEDADMLKRYQRDVLYAGQDGAADAALKVGIGRGMETGKGGGTTDAVGLGIGVAIGSDVLKKKEEK